MEQTKTLIGCIVVQIAPQHLESVRVQGLQLFANGSVLRCSWRERGERQTIKTAQTE